jgi:hypothetical protein
MYPLIIPVTLSILWVISRRFSETLFILITSVVRSRSLAISILTIILLPGTIIHELAHLFTAEVLGVRTGKLTLIPEAAQIHESEVQAGSVQIAQTDPLRRTIVGVAPLIVGIIGITVVSSLILPSLPLETPDRAIRTLLNIPLPQLILGTYLILIISATMTPSNRDLEGAFGVALVVLLVVIGAFLIGFRITLTGKSLELALNFSNLFGTSLLIALALNSMLLLLMKILVMLIGKMTSKSR